MNTPLNTGSRKGPARVVFDQVTKRYVPKGPAAVDNVSLTFAAGHLTTLLGPSGCGKTTTLRMIAGLEMATSGRILIDNDDVTRLPATARDVSMVFQSYALFPHMTVTQNVSYGLQVSGFPKDVVAAKAADVLKQLDLEALGARYPNELSGGQQQRVAVARALVLTPRVLLFDEPLSNLDAKLRRYVRQEIRELQQSLGLTVIYVTHDQEEALAVSDTIVVMNNAVVAQVGSPRDLHERPATRFVADFIGEANLLPCEVLGSGEGYTMVALGALSLKLPGESALRGKRQLAIRPGRVRLHLEAHPNGLSGELARASYLGEMMEYVVRTEFGDVLVATARTDLQTTAGQRVTLELPVESLVLLQD